MVVGAPVIVQATSPDDLLTVHLGTRLLTETEGQMTGEGVACMRLLVPRGFFRTPDGYRGWVGLYIYDSKKLGVFPRDVRGVSPARLAHWVTTPPCRNYQRGAD